MPVSLIIKLAGDPSAESEVKSYISTTDAAPVVAENTAWLLLLDMCKPTHTENVSELLQLLPSS